MHARKMIQPEFGQQLRKARKKAKLSQAALAERLGISQFAVSRVENGLTSKGCSISILEKFLAENSPCADKIDDLLATIGKSEELRALLVRVLQEG